MQSPELASRVTYVQSCVEDLAQHGAGQFDAVVASEVVEHVASVSTFIEACSKLLKVKLHSSMMRRERDVAPW